MMAPMILRSRLFRLIFLIHVSFIASASFAASDQGIHKRNNEMTVVASIRPLHSLLSQLMQNVAQPVLLLDQNQSPHHFSLRPSQRNTLSRADIFFWVGEELESFMPRVINAMPRQVKTIALLENKKLDLLSPRADAPHSSGHSSAHSSGHSHDQAHHAIDPHIWLSVDNAITISEHMYRVLVDSQPKLAAIYLKNFQSLKTKLQALKQQITQGISSRTFNYLVYHDAFQYFEAGLKIAPMAAISNDEEQPPGMRHLLFINRLIKQKNIQCIIFNTSQPPAVARNLVKSANMQQVFIQPLGQNYPPGPDLYFDLMNDLYKGYQQCSLHQLKLK